MTMGNFETGDFAAAVKKAEAASASVSDKDLRKVAFEKILLHLLGGEKASVKSAPPSKDSFRPTLNRKVAEQKKRSGPKAWIEDLLEEGVFSKPQSMSGILEELEGRSHHLRATDLTSTLQSLCHEKKLRRKKLPLKTTEGKSSKSVWHWSAW